MKSKKQSAKPVGSPTLADASESSKGTDGRVPQAKRRRWFRVIAVAVPIANLALLEVILRVAGFGYPTSFFLRSRVNGQDVFIENQQFSRRYFPPGLEREPQPMMFPAVKQTNTVRVFLFGESAAMGDPEPAFGLARIVEVLLGEALPGKRIEVINTAVTAINSHVIREIARDAADKQGDYWVVYMGNNEVVGPFGAGTVFGNQTPGLGFIRASLALKTTRLGQLLDALRHKLTKHRGRPTSWEGMEMFLHQQVGLGDPRMNKVYSHFESNLRDIIRMGEQSGAKVLVGTVASNLKDCPPFASKHRPGLADQRRAEWVSLFAAGIAHQKTNDSLAALDSFNRAAIIDDQHAELQFRIAQCQTRLERVAEAKKTFERARDLDALRFRADGRVNDIIRRVASDFSSRQVALRDFVAECNQASPLGIAGDELFYEHVHLNFEGNYRLARASVESMVGVATNAPSLPAPEECARRLAFTDFDRFRVLDEVRKRLQAPPFTTQLDHEERDRRVQKELDRLQSASFSNAVDHYEQAIARAPHDSVLRENFATLLQDFGRTAEAETHWRKAIQLLPHSEQAHFGLANVLDGQGKSGEATVYFRQALRLRPGSLEARNGLALALANQGRTEEALAEYHRALRINPGFVEARINLGQMLVQQGREAEAMTQYLEALRLDSNNVATRVNVGRLLSKQGKFSEAARHYRDALRLKPDHAIAHYNLGNTLNALSDNEGATLQFAEAVRWQPNLFEARYNLGLGLARQNRNSEALEHLGEAVRLNPGVADARFNYGVALAKASRYDDAIREFGETLRLDPNNTTAKRFLEQARARKGQP